MGSDTFLECYDGKTEWTYIDDEGSATDGVYLQESADTISFVIQVDEAKRKLIRILGEKVTSSQLRVSNHREDRYTW
jgi:hypothetical protein